MFERADTWTDEMRSRAVGLARLREATVCEDGADKHVGRLLAGRYALLEPIGVGGMARVYRGRHVPLRRSVAVKILREEFACKASFVGRFLREARATARIRHPNVVEILDFGQEPDGTVYCVMELLPGEPLSETLVREGRLSWQRTKDVMLQVCDALAAAHAVGVVHRDVKPDNCLRLAGPSSETARDVIKIIDFGIAKMFGDDDPLPGGRTARGTVMGTADYIAPEQARGSDTDHRTDIYGAGVMMYELLTGQVPFSASSSLDLLAQHMYVVPEPPSVVAPLAHIPPEADAAVLRALSKDREARFQSIAEMRSAIETLDFDPHPDASVSYLPGRSECVAAEVPAPRRWGRVAAAATVLLASAGLITFGLSDDPTAVPVDTGRIEHVTTTGPIDLEPEEAVELPIAEPPIVVEAPLVEDLQQVPSAIRSERIRPIVGGRQAPPPPAAKASIVRRVVRDDAY